MARRTADNKASELELEPDTPHRGVAPDLRARLAELPGSHPSAVGYVRDEHSARRLGSSPERDNAAALTNEVDGGERPRGDSPGVSVPADYTCASDVKVTADRRTHILDGDQTGGGHRHGTGEPGKTEFPAEWADDHIIDAVLAVAREPGQAPERQDWNDRWQVGGKHDGVEIVAIVESDGSIWTAWPREGSPGVVKNPIEET